MAADNLTTRGAATDRGRQELAARQMTARALTVRADTVDESARTVVATMATPTTSQVYDWSTDRFIDETLVLTGAIVGNQVPLLANHWRYSLNDLLGAVRDISISDAAIVGRLHLSSDPEAEAVFRKIVEGHLTDVSIGYEPIEYADIQPGQTQVVAGRSYTAGDRTLRVTTSFRIAELSLVLIGADPNAKLRGDRMRYVVRTAGTIAGKARQVGDVLTLDPTAAAPFIRSGLIAAFRAEGEATPEDENTDEAREGEATDETEEREGETDEEMPAEARAAFNAGQQRERRRQAAIRSLAGRDVPARLINQAIERGWTPDQAARRFLEEIRMTRRGPAIHDRTRATTRTAQALAAGLILRQLPDPRTKGPRAALQPGALYIDERAADDGHRYRSMLLIDICREALILSGRSVPHDRSELIRRALSNASLAGIFTTSVNATLIASYETAPDTTDWCAVTEVSNFQAQDYTQLGSMSGLKKHARGGTAQHATIADNTETYRVSRYTEQFQIDEIDIINDNLRALTKLPAELGAAAAELRPDLVYAVLLRNAALADGIALFHSSHNNLLGSGSAFDADAVQNAVTQMAKQTKDGRTLNLSPTYLLVPPDLRFKAEILIASTQRMIAADSGGTYNPLQNLVQIRTENRIGVAGVIDPDTEQAYAGTATNYFLVADPAKNASIQVAYLIGSRQPQIRPFQLDRGQWGMGWDIKLDVGAAAVGYHGINKSTGAS